MSIDIEFLKSIPYFSGLDNAELESIKGFFFERTAQRGDFVLDEGEPGEILYFVVSGAAQEVKTSAEGKEQILRIIRPGESFNDVPVFDGGPSLASVVAMGPVILYGVSRADIAIILRNHPRVAANAIKVLAERVRHFASLVEDLSFRPVVGRVAKLLLEYAADGPGPRPRLTQQEMAAMVGTAREMVGRSLKALEEKGAIRIDRHRIVVVDKEALRETAGEPS
jgi:CRP-like cAMP-binding protein